MKPSSPGSVGSSLHGFDVGLSDDFDDDFGLLRPVTSHEKPSSLSKRPRAALNKTVNLVSRQEQEIVESYRTTGGWRRTERIPLLDDEDEEGEKEAKRVIETLHLRFSTQHRQQAPPAPLCPERKSTPRKRKMKPLTPIIDSWRAIFARRTADPWRVANTLSRQRPRVKFSPLKRTIDTKAFLVVNTTQQRGLSGTPTEIWACSSQTRPSSAHPTPVRAHPPPRLPLGRK